MYQIICHVIVMIIVQLSHLVYNMIVLLCLGSLSIGQTVLKLFDLVTMCVWYLRICHDVSISFYAVFSPPLR